MWCVGLLVCQRKQKGVVFDCYFMLDARVAWYSYCWKGNFVLGIVVWSGDSYYGPVVALCYVCSVHKWSIFLCVVLHWRCYWFLLPNYKHVFLWFRHGCMMLNHLLMAKIWKPFNLFLYSSSCCEFASTQHVCSKPFSYLDQCRVVTPE
jgi:hypothetical protein